ncbi:MAG: hypothetical protein HFG45_09725 [Oscillospiraceae bacterium]|jgi:ADP-ribosylglycohydrolase|nr:hypothetical protein [Oscillospiraceae bacterium]
MKDRNKYRGCLIGGATGDALGYAVEFLQYDTILKHYGKNGITEYDRKKGVALISDDTQMALFTADALLMDAPNGMSSYVENIYHCYLDWYRTQTETYPVQDNTSRSRLLKTPELFSRRAPGNTCLAALGSKKFGTIEQPINQSKGCGGVMRVAPIGLRFNNETFSIKEIDQLGAAAAALTHGHDLGYLPAAALVHIIHLVSHSDIPLRDAVTDMRETLPHQFPASAHLQILLNLIDRAIALANSDLPDVGAIEQLGEGWVAEETLAIALYCALKYESNFDRALIAAVNHNGDSDSTGAVTGNILGAYLGLDSIPEKYLDGLELKDLILETADALYDSQPSNHQETTVILFPGLEQLKNTMEKLKTELSMLVLERDELRFVICKNIETAYMLKLGALEHRAYEAQCKALRLKRKIELIQAKKNRQEPVKLKEIEVVLDQEFAEYQTKLDEQIRQMNEAIERSQGDLLTPDEIKELKKLYRSIVKALHPDLNPEVTDSQFRLFENAVTAYENGDLSTMRIISEMMSPPAVFIQPEDALRQLNEEKRRLEERLSELQTQIEQIKRTYPYTLAEYVDDPKKAEERQKELNEILEYYQQCISLYEERIKNLLR